MNASQPLPPLPGWTSLAQGWREGDSVSQCPGGHIHRDYGNLAVRMGGDEFLGLSMVTEAMARLGGPSSFLRPPPGHDTAGSISLN